MADSANTDLLLLTRGELEEPYRLPDAKLLLLNVKEHRKSQNARLIRRTLLVTTASIDLIIIFLLELSLCTVLTWGFVSPS